LPTVVFIVLLILFDLWLISRIFSFDSYIISSTKIKVISIFGYTKKVINIDDFISWSEIEKSNNRINWKELALSTSEFEIKINSSYYFNYEQMKDAVTRGLEEDLSKTLVYSRKINLFFSFFSFFIAILFFFFCYQSFNNYNKEIKEFQLIEIVDQVENITISRGKSKSLDIKLINNPSYQFEINSVSLSATYLNDFNANVKVGDTVFIKISNEIYKSKITKEKKPKFWDRSINYFFIEIFELRDKNQSYLNLADLNMKIKEDSKIGLFLFFGIALFFTIVGIYYLKSKKSS
jgi:hypothetical protein